MNPVIMPYVGALDLTQAAIRDVLAQTLPDMQLLLIANGTEVLEDAGDSRVLQWHHHPSLPALAATWNRALQWAWESGADHCLGVNNDVRLPPELYAALLLAQQRTDGWFITAANAGERWDVVKTTPILPPDEAFFTTRGGPDFSCFLITQECHRWFQFDEGFIPAYHEDNDYHRRLQLAGFGDRIFSVSIPYLHYGSGTLRHSPAVQGGWGPRFVACQQYYVEKWGGLPGQETRRRPFHEAADDIDIRPYLFGQGKNDGHPLWSAFHAQAL